MLDIANTHVVHENSDVMYHVGPPESHVVGICNQHKCIYSNYIIMISSKTSLSKTIRRLAIAYIVYETVIKRWIKRQPRLEYMTASPVASYLAKTCKTLQYYMPTPYLISGLIQTLSGEARGPNVGKVKTKTIRNTILLPEEKRPKGLTCCPQVIPAGEISVDWIVCNDDVNVKASKKPVIIIVPGLTGDSSATYVQTIAAKVCANGYRACCYNPRGRGGNRVENPFLYSAGYTHDLRRAILYVKQQVAPDVSIFAAGFSLGSNYLAKYVGEEGDKCILDGAVCCACPTDCLSMSNHLEHSVMGRMVMDPLLVSLVQKMRKEMEHIIHLHPKVDVPLVRKASTMSQFDHSIIAPMFGFDCVSDYYRYSSCSLHMSTIRRPTMFIHAWNDPVVPGKYVRMDNFRVNPYLLECMTDEGGHSMIWPTGVSCDSWVGGAICEFFDNLQTPEYSKSLKELKTQLNVVPAAPVIDHFFH